MYVLGHPLRLINYSIVQSFFNISENLRNQLFFNEPTFRFYIFQVRGLANILMRKSQNTMSSVAYLLYWFQTSSGEIFFKGTGYEVNLASASFPDSG